MVKPIDILTSNLDVDSEDVLLLTSLTQLACETSSNFGNNPSFNTHTSLSVALTKLGFVPNTLRF